MAQTWGDVSLAAHPQKRARFDLTQILDGGHSKHVFRASSPLQNLASSNLLSFAKTSRATCVAGAGRNPFPVPPAPIHRSSAENLLDGRRVDPACPSSLPPSKDARPPGLSSFDHGLQALPRQTKAGEAFRASPTDSTIQVESYPSSLSFSLSSSAPPEDGNGPRLPCRARA